MTKRVSRNGHLDDRIEKLAVDENPADPPQNPKGNRHAQQGRDAVSCRCFHHHRVCRATDAAAAEPAGGGAGAAGQGQGQGRGGQAAGTVTVWAPITMPSERIDADLNAKFRAEGMDRSKIMWIMHYLADVYGPRPTGSPNHVAAADWAIKTMTSWGMTNGHKEPFTWRGIGWLPGRASGFITSPVKAESEVRSRAVVAVDERHCER